MKKISSVLILFLLIFKISLASTYSSDPQMFVQELVNDSISKLSDKNLDEEEKANFIESVAIENVDIYALGLYTLGELRKSADDGKPLTHSQPDHEVSKIFINIAKKIIEGLNSN